MLKWPSNTETKQKVLGIVRHGLVLPNTDSSLSLSMYIPNILIHFLSHTSTKSGRLELILILAFSLSTALTYQESVWTTVMRVTAT